MRFEKRSIRLLVAAVLGLTGVLLVPQSVHATTVNYFDNTFNPANWGLHAVKLGTGGSTMANQVGSGSGAYRYVANWVNKPAPGNSSLVSGVHVNHLATYDPGLTGAITSLDYSESSIMFRGFGEGQATGAALVQNGNLYVSSNPRLLANDGVWTQETAFGLTSSSFYYIGSLSSTAWAPNGALHPDFSELGGLIIFGFYRANSACVNCPGYDIEGGIDNWAIRVNAAELSGPNPGPEPETIPEPATILLLGVAIAGFRRRFPCVLS